MPDSYVKKEPIIDRYWRIHGFEVLTVKGKKGDDRGALDLILTKACCGKQKLFINLPPEALFSREIKEMLFKIGSIVPLVVEILEVEPYNPLTLPLLPFPYALDDWGTGYSNLLTLLRVLRLKQFKYIKIDREIFVPLLRERKGRTFLTSLLDFITENGKIPIFEKVETEEEFLELLYLSPEEVLFQGFYVEKQLSLIKSQKGR